MQTLDEATALNVILPIPADGVTVGASRGSETSIQQYAIPLTPAATNNPVAAFNDPAKDTRNIIGSQEPTEDSINTSTSLQPSDLTKEMRNAVASQGPTESSSHYPTSPPTTGPQTSQGPTEDFSDYSTSLQPSDLTKDVRNVIGSQEPTEDFSDYSTSPHPSDPTKEMRIAIASQEPTEESINTSTSLQPSVLKKEMRNVVASQEPTDTSNDYPTGPPTTGPQSSQGPAAETDPGGGEEALYVLRPADCARGPPPVFSSPRGVVVLDASRAARTPGPLTCRWTIATRAGRYLTLTLRRLATDGRFAAGQVIIIKNNK